MIASDFTIKGLLGIYYKTLYNGLFKSVWLKQFFFLLNLLFLISYTPLSLMAHTIFNIRYAKDAEDGNDAKETAQQGTVWTMQSFFMSKIRQNITVWNKAQIYSLACQNHWQDE